MVSTETFHVPAVTPAAAGDSRENVSMETSAQLIASRLEVRRNMLDRSRMASLGLTGKRTALADPPPGGKDLLPLAELVPD